MALLWWNILRRQLKGLMITGTPKTHIFISSSESKFLPATATPCFDWMVIFPGKRSCKEQGQGFSSLHCDNLHLSAIMKHPVLTKSRWGLRSPRDQLFQLTVSVPGFMVHRCLSTSASRHTPVAVESTINAAEVATAVASSRPLWFPDFPTIHLAESLITMAHSITGLPWWSSIVLTTFVCRMGLMMFPAVYRDINQKRLQQLDPELRDLREKVRADILRARKEYAWSEKKCQSEFRAMMNRLSHERYLRDNCHPMKFTVVPWFQLPLWVSVSLALRNMSTRAGNPSLENHSSYVGYVNEGVAWIPDLTAADTTLILPVLMSAVTLFNVEMMYLNMAKVTIGRKLLIYALRIFSLSFIPLGAMQPSAMVLYWVTSALCASGQTLLLNYSPFRRSLKLPKSVTESDTPIRSLLAKAKTSYRRKTQ